MSLHHEVAYYVLDSQKTLNQRVYIKNSPNMYA